MVERSLTISQARNLLRMLSERSQAHLRRLGEQVSGVAIGPEVAPENAQVTQRLLEFIRDHAEESNPRIRLRLFTPDEEITVGAPVIKQKRRQPSDEEVLESRAQR